MTHPCVRPRDDLAIERLGTDPTDARRRTGASGERAAAEYLAGRGLALVERNARTRFGELDLICAGGGALVFVEVKTLVGRGEQDAERALDSIGPRKRLQVRRLARAWLAERRSRPGYEEVRFDAVGVSVAASGRVNGLVHVPAAF
ncbi:MAG TPA: YraN family protein [Solirubrobacterales bacterium]|nr:YraN family protein [Solirubrobacterales bacterium]